MSSGIGSYQKTSILGKSPLELLLLVYNGAIEAFKKAEDAFERDDKDRGKDSLARARKFITHLYATLDTKYGGEVAQRLGQLYVFIIEQIQIASATSDTALCANMREILENVKAGWDGINPADSTRKVEDIANPPLNVPPNHAPALQTEDKTG